MNDSAVYTPQQLMQMLNISRATFYRRMAEGAYRRLEIPGMRPRRYSKVLVDRLVARESVTRIGAGRNRSLRAA
jgi:hypothetical protein